MPDSLDRVAIAECAVTIPPGAHDIEALQREPGRVDVAMAGRATFLAAVFGELFANSCRAANIWIKRGHVGRRWRWWLAQQPRHDPGPAFNGGGGRPVGSDLQDARLSQ